MKPPRKTVPELPSEEKARDFWGAPGRDSTEYLDWSKARHARFPNVKLSTQSISLRLPVGLLERIKVEANKRDVPYQSLIKVLLADAVERLAPAVDIRQLKGIVGRRAKPVTPEAMKRAIARRPT